MDRHIYQLVAIAGLLSVVWIGSARDRDFDYTPVSNFDYGFIENTAYNSVGDLTLPIDSPDIDLPWEIEDWSDPNSSSGTGFDLDMPDNINNSVDYDPETGLYNFNSNIGDQNFGYPSTMTLDEYLEYDMDQAIQDYWAEKNEGDGLGSSSGGFRPQIRVGGEAFDRIFGGNTVDIRPQGSAELTFGINVSRTDNPQLPEKQRKITTFDFNQRIQLNVIGNIGEKLKLTTSYNTEATFDFENQMKLEYTGYEDEIIKKIEAGNVSLPLNGSLITGSQSLFGIKTELQFGRLTATTIFSQQKGKRSEVEVSGGAQVSDFEIKADNYEANRHYFLSQYFRDSYDNALSSLPVVASGINITRIEVWVTNTNNTTANVRNIIGFADIGEGSGINNNLYHHPQIQDIDLNNDLPYNDQNNLYGIVSSNASIRGFFNANSALAAPILGGSEGLDQSVDYERVENARMLTPQEYSYNSRLGFISLNQALNNDEVLAVSYEYTFQGETYRVGEFSTDGVTGSDAILLKLLKGTTTRPKLPIWDLMMKNVYSIGAYQVNREDFLLEVWYTNPQTGVDINYIPRQPIDGIPLVQVLNLDRFNLNNSPTPDGVFDFVDNAATQGGTINAQNGRVFFPVVEPFGSHLESKLVGLDTNIINTIVYQQLYDSTKTAAQQIPELNRFWMKGRYKSASSSEISLNALNIPQGSVTVTAGGVQLTENVDYTVDYTLGRVKIINSGLLESQTPIKISLESNSLFNIQTKTLMGTHLDYKINKDFNIGATFMKLSERPLTQKVNIGDEPINNSMVGFDLNYRTKSGFLTSLVDKLPLYDTKEESNVSIVGEYARIIPGHSRAIGKDGVSYIDDFEGSQSAIDMRSVNTWVLASIPEHQPTLFPEGDLDSANLASGFNRAKLSWYVIDPLFWSDNSLTPSHIAGNDQIQGDNFMREIRQSEVFPNRELQTGQLDRIPALELAFYPEERGQYNFDVDGQDEAGVTWSAGVDADGKLIAPETRWGGIMRQVQTNDFEAANIEYIQFWILDPNEEDNLGGGAEVDGELYFNLGNVSEDILKDDKKSFENGLSTDGNFDASILTETIWGWVPITQSIVNAFDNDETARANQDVGLDGLDDAEENTFYADFLNKVNNSSMTSAAKSAILVDPSTDNYHYYRGSDYDNQQLDILERYKLYNGVDGNSPTTGQSPESYPTAATTLPNIEDINQDNNLSTTESYFQYVVKINSTDLNPGNIGNNYINDVLVTYPSNNRDREVTWYQIKIPVRDPDAIINNIQDFRSIRFMRVFMRGFEVPVVLRFARLDLIRGEWRRYDLSLQADGEYIQDDPPGTTFNISAVNVEENGNRSPIRYVVPPGINQEIDVATANLRRLNEQSMTLEVCNLIDGDARAAYKNVDMDVRSYKKLKMFIHAEEMDPNFPLNDDDVTLFVRMGADFNQNYYEYEIPLKVTPWGSANANDIWPDANNVEIVFSRLKAAKTSRNQFVDNGGGTINNPFSVADGNNRITVRGNPNLSNVKTVMIGIRNPYQEDNNPWKPDDGQPKCVEVWVNELRLTDFDQRGGWAATARLNAQLADLGNFAIAGNYSTPYWGSIEKKVSERQRETIKQMDASSNIEMGKFIPEKIGIRIPMYVGYSEGVSNPQFDPLDPDIEFNDKDQFLNKEERRDRLKQSQTYTKRRSINFTNVRKERGKNAGKPHFYDVSNVSLTYAYNESFMRDINIEHNANKTYRGGLSYAFNASPKVWRPFNKSKFLKRSKYLRLIRDFNLYTGVKQMGFRTDINRSYSEILTRSNTDAITIPQYPKTFTWSRVYDFKYDISKSLKVDFNANNNAIIGEPDGRVNKKIDPESYEVFKDSVLQSIREFGETTDYGHTANVNYNLPLNKFPMTDWISVTAGYSGAFGWQRAPLSQDTLGHTIQNSRTRRLNGQLNMVTLYNKVGFFKKVNQKYGRGGRRGRASSNRRPPANNNQNDSTKTKKQSNFKITEQMARIIMAVKNISVTYSENDGTLLPGYNRTTNAFGRDNGVGAPGLPFLFGHQDGSFAETAAQNEWLVKNPYLNNPHVNTHTETFNARSTIEPLGSLRIELSANQNKSSNLTEFFRWGMNDFGDSTYVHDSPLQTGSFSMSIITWKTAFETSSDETESAVFDKFSENRAIISELLGNDNPNSIGLVDEYYDGYDESSQAVVVPAFIAAYSGRNPRSVKTNPFKMIPKPNWSVTYTGLSKIEFFKKYFKQVTVGHAYRSSFSIASYTTNLQYGERNGSPSIRDAGGNFILERQITAVTISEQFSPLINVDVTLNNSIIAKVEIKKDRNLALSLANNQLTEVRGNELVIGSGYKMKEVQLPFKFGNGKKLKSDLNLRADISIRNNSTVTRQLDGPSQVTAGQTIISIKTAADYVISNQLNVRLFFDKVITKPRISTTFPTSNTNAGLSLRFTLAS